MDVRAFLKEWVRSKTPDDDEFDLRFYQGTALKGVPVPPVRPLLVYRMGNTHHGLEGDDVMAAVTQPVLLYGYDAPGDFGALLDPLMNLLANTMGQPLSDELKEAFPEVIKLELDYISEDNWDHEWGLAMRYLRFWIHYRNPDYEES